MGSVLSCLRLRKNTIHEAGDPEQPLQSISHPSEVNKTNDQGRSLNDDPGTRGETANTRISASEPEANENKVSKRSPAARTAAEGLKLALNLAEKALDGLPIPGAKGAFGIVLKLIEDAEVCRRLSFAALELLS
jgi:hypothetical protein